MALNPTKTVTNPRIAKLIELEVAGRIKPEHQQELDTYRAQGLAPKKATSDLTENQSKTTGFYGSALQANNNFLAAGVGGDPVGIGGDVARAMLPEGVVNANTSPERQKAQQARDDFIRASLRVESGAAIGQEEYDRQNRIFFPQTGDSPEVIAQKAAARLQVIEGLKTGAGDGAGQVDTVAVPGAERSSKALETAAPSPDQAAISPTGAAIFSTEQDRAFAAAAQSAFDKGASRADLDQLAVQYGYGRFPADLDAAIGYRNRGGKGARIGVPVSGSKGPTTLGTLAATGLGAGVTGVANALTAGTLDNIVGMTGGDQAQAQAAKEAMAAANPVPYALGNVAGGVGAALGGEFALGAAAARMGVPAALSRVAVPVASDVAYGAASGAGETENGSRTLGALKGAGAALGGNVAGRALGVLTGRGVSPSGGALRPLYDAGVRPTPGQRFGGPVNWVEQNLGSVPFVGGAIRGARQEARDQFERGGFNDALGDIGQRLPDNVPLGTEPHRIMQDAFNTEYAAARRAMTFQPDQQYISELGAFRNRVNSGVLNDQEVQQVRNILNTSVQSRLTAQGGALTGDAYLEAASEIGAAARQLSRTNPAVAEALTEYSGIFEQAARRASPPDVVARLDDVDRGYAKAVRIENASARAGEQGRFTPAQFSRAVQQESGGVRSRAFLRGDALMDDYANAGRSLMDTVPNSGTPERAMLAAALTGGVAKFVSPAAAVPALAGLAYAPGARRVLTGALAPRQSQRLRTLGDWLRDQQRGAGVLGGVGSGVAVPLLVAPETP